MGKQAKLTKKYKYVQIESTRKNQREKAQIRVEKQGGTLGCLK